MNENYHFDTKWLNRTQEVWDFIIDATKPTKILEIGLGDGRTTTHLINKMASTSNIEIYALDTLHHGLTVERKQQLDRLYKKNVDLAIKNASHQVDLKTIQGQSLFELSKLLIDKKEAYFDFIYITNASSMDILAVASMAFELLKQDHCIIFDNYISDQPQHIIDTPKMGIDAFVNTYINKLSIVNTLLYQLPILKKPMVIS